MICDKKNIKEQFTDDTLNKIFPKDRSNRFFDALLGDAHEGAYDIELSFQGENSDQLEFRFNLRRRPGKCLACNLTHGLPKVFSMHPIIDVTGVVEKIETLLNGTSPISHWRLGKTHEVSSNLHFIPLFLSIQKMSS